MVAWAIFSRLPNVERSVAASVLLTDFTDVRVSICNLVKSSFFVKKKKDKIANRTSFEWPSGLLFSMIMSGGLFSKV